jgi:hypothetical protein
LKTSNRGPILKQISDNLEEEVNWEVREEVVMVVLLPIAKIFLKANLASLMGHSIRGKDIEEQPTK